MNKLFVSSTARHSAPPKDTSLLAGRNTNLLTPKSATGFTLVELLAVMAITGLILSMGVPSFQNLVANNRLTAQTHSFLSAMRLARSEAIKRRARIDVIATTADEGNEWGGGWRVAVSGGATLKNFQSLDGSATLDSADDVVSFQYQPSGRSNRVGTLYLCDDRDGETGRQISVATTGKITSTTYLCT